MKKYKIHLCCEIDQKYFLIKPQLCRLCDTSIARVTGSVYPREGHIPGTIYEVRRCVFHCCVKRENIMVRSPADAQQLSRLHAEVTGTKARTLITAAVRCTTAAIMQLLYSTEYILLLLVCSFEASSLLVKTNIHRSSWLIYVPMIDESTRFAETYQVAGRPGGVSGYHSSSPV